MSVNLKYKHQQKTYTTMKEEVKKGKKVAYIYPVGCGKSFPGLKHIEDNPEKNSLIVVSSIAIANQYKKYIKSYVKNGEELLKNKQVHIVTYHKIARALENCKKNNTRMINFEFDPGIIIFDEIHRIGAMTWEGAVEYVMNKYKNADIIGMSATPERTDKRDMAKEKFDKIIYEMSLTEALNGEKEGEVILKTPRYIRVISELSEKLPSYREKIEKIKDDEKKSKLIKKYEKLEETVSRFPSLEDVMADGIKRKNGKYIVFCRDANDLFEKMNDAQKIFGKVNEKINMDYVLSEPSNGGKTRYQNRITLENFENRDNGNNLNLLFCVDMLNEGIHLTGIDGEVMFRPTESKILYKQIIGRVLSADKNAGETVIIDAVNNWLRQKETYDEIEKNIKEGEKRDKTNYNLFELTPEETDLLQIMREIDEEYDYSVNAIKDAIEIRNWCERTYKNEPLWKRNLPTVGKNARDDYERKLARKLNGLNNRIRQYRGIKLEDISNDTDREITEIIRNLYKNFDIDVYYKNALEIEDWCKEKYGLVPIWKRSLPTRSKDSGEEEVKLAIKYQALKSQIKEYNGILIEDIPDETIRRIVAVVRSIDENYGMSTYRKNALEVEEWCKEKYRDMPIYERHLPYGTEGEYEKQLARKVSKIRSIITQQYSGIELKDIKDEEHRKIVEIMRRIEENYDLNAQYKNILEIEEWCKRKYKDKPIYERHLPSRMKKATKPEIMLEKKLQGVREYARKYDEKELDEIEDCDDRKIVEALRRVEKEYNLNVHYRNILQIKEWCEIYNEGKPIEERRLPSKSAIDEEERKLGTKLSWIKGLLSSNPNRRTTQNMTDTDAKNILEVIEYLNKEYNPRYKENNAEITMKKAVGEKVKNNERTREELIREIEKMTENDRKDNED